MFNFISLIIYVLCVLIVYLIARILYKKKKGIDRTQTSPLREIIMACLVAYGTAMFVLLFMHNSGGFTGFIDKSYLEPIERLKTGLGVNLVPFKTITDFISSLDSPYFDNSQTVIRNLLGNIFLFTPIGLAMALLWKRWQSIIRMFLFSIFVPCCIEFIQLFIGRSVDIDDVILNFIGLMTGFLIGKFFLKLAPSFSKRYITL